MSDDNIQKEIDAFEAMRADLEKHHLGKFVIIKDGKLAGTFDTFNAAAQEAIRQFPDEKFLIRQVGVPGPIRLPASVVWRPLHAAR